MKQSFAAKSFAAKTFACGALVGVGVVVITSPAITIQVPLSVRRSLERGLNVTVAASRPMEVRVSRSIGLTVRTAISLDELPAGAQE